MTGLSCLDCGDELETWGVYGHVIPSLFCGNCCSAFVQPTEDNSPIPHTVSKARALTYYGCTKTDLKELHSGWMKGKREDTTQLYLAREVDFVGRQRNVKRKNQLEIDLGVDLKSLRDILRIYLLGDYLQRSNQRKTTLKEVKQRFGAIDRVEAILKEVPSADPAAAFDFAVQYSEAGPVEFLDLRERCQKAFRLMGEKFVGMLSDEDRSKLIGTPLEGAVKEYRIEIQRTGCSAVVPLTSPG